MSLDYGRLHYPSTLYDGGGTTNALQTAALESTLAGLTTAPADIKLNGDWNLIRVWLANTTATKTCTLCVGQFDKDGNLVEVTESSVTSTDQTFDTDQDAWGLTTGTNVAAKPPLTVAFKRHSEYGAAAVPVLKLWVSATNGGAWYARYQLEKKQ